MRHKIVFSFLKSPGERSMNYQTILNWISPTHRNDIRRWTRFSRIMSETVDDDKLQKWHDSILNFQGLFIFFFTEKERRNFV